MLRIKKIGSFFIGGYDATVNGMTISETSVVANGPKREVNPNGTFKTGQMYVQYAINEDQHCKYPVLFWHGGGMTGACWESTPDGRDGWQTYFLKKGYDVYLSDAVERGRASWSRFPGIYTSEPLFRSKEEAWKLFRIGDTYTAETKQAFSPQQFPTEAFEDFTKQLVPRWTTNQEITQRAYDQLIEKVGPCIIIAHSQGSQFAIESTSRHPNLVKALVLIEPSSAPKAETFLPGKTGRIPHLYLWGDHLKTSLLWQKYRDNVSVYYNSQKICSANVRWLDLPQIGIFGNSHCLMGDKNSDQIADLIHEWLLEVTN